MLDTLIEEANFVCLDTETTGLDPIRGGRICEVAVLGSKGAKRVEAYSTLLNPQVLITPEVSAIHGITNDMVRNSPTFEAFAPRLLTSLQGSVLVCHNADFDTAFLRSEFERIGLKMPDVFILDTLKFARCNGNFSKNRLGVIAKELGISNDGWHRAMADTIMTERIFYYFINKFKRFGARTIGDLSDFQKNKVCKNAA
ncbi:MAG: 3'-5' exonuclease [Elusimicrobiota bacterium]|jgi:DNA polymerase III epsilon subunit family exonuclease|nr:3'-5' exonuclease [Elusimicrobiota bacterium]